MLDSGRPNFFSFKGTYDGAAAELIAPAFVEEALIVASFIDWTGTGSNIDSSYIDWSYIDGAAAWLIDYFWAT